MRIVTTIVGAGARLMGPGPRLSRGISWEELRHAELDRVKNRRAWLAKQGEPVPDNHVALALSGGGIRSATFSLGVLKALSKLGLVRKIDYLSTVSGGGYAGSFFCSLFVPQDRRGTAPGAASAPQAYSDRARELTVDVLGGPVGKASLGQLREGGHYLTPSGTSDSLFAAAVALRNWVAVAFVTGLAVLSVFMAVNLVRTPDVPWLRNPAAAAAPAVPASAEAGPEAAARAQAPDDARALSCTAGLDGAKVSAKCDVAPAPAERKAEAKPFPVGPPLGASWLWLVAAAILPFWSTPCAWAYWMIPDADAAGEASLFAQPAIRVAAAVSLVMGGAAISGILLRPGLTAFAAATAIAAALGFVAYLFANWRTRADDRNRAGGASAVAAAADDARVTLAGRVRTKLSRWLDRSFVVALCLAALALTDDAGRLVYHMLIAPAGYAKTAFATGALGTLSALGVPAARWLLKRLQAHAPADGGKLKVALLRVGGWLALAAGVLLLFALLTLWSAVAGLIVWRLQPQTVSGAFGAWPMVVDPRGFDLVPLLGSFAAFAPPFVVAVAAGSAATLLGTGHSFLNQSSLASFYAGRLRKAYLGASNDLRRTQQLPPDLEMPSDEISLVAYYDAACLAPVHIINVTINETSALSSRVIQRDRKGKGLTISPGGYGYVPGAPASPVRGFPLVEGEQLPLSSWIGISGAAFSTGMGQNTTLGLSLVAGLTNLRLGYWWNSPLPPSRSDGHATAPLTGFAGDLVQSYLLREIRADFEGTHSNRWYLSDGGHFENTGVYELVRRRVPFIISCDNGADPNYEFADLVNLMRKLRIDLGAEVEMVGADELDDLLGGTGALREAFGALEDIIPEAGQDAKGRSGPYAALGRIKYETPPADEHEAAVTTLLLIKPRVTGGELPDLIRYQKSNIAFPQQPTTDQFFDEAQWESYFRLGQLIAETIFAPPPSPPGGARWPWKPVARRWSPASLKPLP